MTKGNLKIEKYRGRKVYFLSSKKRLSYGKRHVMAFIKMPSGEERIVGTGYTKEDAFKEAKIMLDKYYIKFRGR